MTATDPDDFELTREISNQGNDATRSEDDALELQRCGRYEVLGFLGRGGFGTVYEGFDSQLQRKVAIKLPLLKRLKKHDSERYQLEARDLAKLQHRGIVAVYDVGIEGDRFYIVTELLDGQSLYRWLHRNSPSWRETAEIIAMACDAIAHAHARKVIHRDIKPDNMIMVPDRGPVLIDFGLALSGTNSGDQIGSVQGTYRYMAPEQVEGRAHRIDGRTDIYALGAILYQMLTGNYPFDAQSRRELCRQIVHDDPQPPRQIDPGIPKALEAVCLRAMSKSVSQRFTTAADMAEILHRIAAEKKPIIAESLDLTRTRKAPEPDADVDKQQGFSSKSVAGRRHVTLLHIALNVRGLSDDPSDFHPEDQIEAIEVFQSACKDHFDQYGGSPLPSSGQEVLICFGYPLSFEDAPGRAVLAGIAIQQMLPRIAEDLAKRLQLKLRVWISIHSGMVITSGTDSESLVGDVLTLVNKIDRETESGEVIITEDTHRLVRNKVYCEPLDATCSLPGEDAVKLLRVDHAISRESDGSETEEVEFTPLVGRDQELGMLRDRWELVGEGYGQLVALIGDAGLGKSRLVQELKDYVVSSAPNQEESAIIEWSCSPYHTNSAFYCAKESLQHVLGFERDLSEPERQLRLRDHLRGLGLELSHAVPLFGELLSLPPDDEFPPLALTSPRKKELTLDFLGQWLIANAQRRPTLFIVEDLHWIDPSTLDFLHQLADAPISDPLLCLITFRPEFTTPWTSRAHQTQIALSRLTRSQVSQILVTKAEGGQVASGIIDRIAQRTDGVPLFVEEYSKMLVESTESLTDTIDEWTDKSNMGTKSGGMSIPATLQGLLTARLDRVVGDPSVVRLAAALGREFSFELIRAACELPEADLAKELKKLVDSELLFRKGNPPTCSYLFKHALIQDAAYDSMLRRQRREVHQRIADALQSQSPEINTQKPELLAHHRTEAGQQWEAAPLWEAAGSMATERGEFVEAVQHLQHGMEALERVPESTDRDRMEYQMNVPLGIATLSVKGYAAPELGGIYDRRMELCEKLGDAMGQLHAKWAMGSWRIVRDEIDLSLKIGEEIMEMGHAMHDDGALAEALFIQAIAQFYHADFEASLASCQQSLDLCDPERCLYHTSRTGQHCGVANLSYMALCHWYLGQPASALARMKEARRLAEGLDHAFSVAFALHHSGWLGTAMQRGDHAVEFADQQIRHSQEHAFFFWETTGMLFRAGGLNCLRRYEEASEMLQAGLARYEVTGAELALSQYNSFLAVAQWKLGDLDAAEESLSAGFAAVKKSYNRFHEPELWRLRGRLAASRGDHATAQCHAQQAIDVARQYSALPWELAALIDLAEWLEPGAKRDATVTEIRAVANRFETCADSIPILQQAAAVT